MFHELMQIQNQILAEAQRQWGGLAEEMRRARREFFELEAANRPTPAEQDLRSLEAGRDTATAQDAWNTVNGAG